MNKKKFHQLLSRGDALTDSELKQLEDLQQSYPFSQVIHAVIAKTHLDRKSSLSNAKLGIAAMYSTNRKVLKNFIELKGVAEDTPVRKVKSDQGKVTEPSPKTTEVKTKTAPVDKEKDASTRTAKSSPAKAPPRKKSGPTTKSEKQSSPNPKELAPPKKVKKVPETSTARKGISEKVQKRPDQPTKSKESKPDEMDKVRAEVMVNLDELKKHITFFQEGMKGPGEKKKKKAVKGKAKSVTVKGKKQTTTKSRVKKPVENQLIEEINTREEKEIGDKQKNQNKLIEDFVQREPEKVKGNEKLTDEQVADLAKESVNFNEDLISENLAIIFSKQGKTDKAIEIYKKLIWKYPQKKTYFATQIEDLEKNRDGSGNR